MDMTAQAAQTIDEADLLSIFPAVFSEAGETAIPDNVSDHTQQDTLALITADGVLGLLGLLGGWVAATLAGQTGFSAILGMGILASFLLPVQASLDLYPGFGLMSAERLRRRWIAVLVVHVPLVVGAALASGPYVMPLVSGFFLMAFAPLVEDMTRIVLHRKGRWGKPVLVAGPAQTLAAARRDLRQNWQIGFKPVTGTDGSVPVVDTLVLTAGTIVTSELSGFANLFVAGGAGTIRRIQPPSRGLAGLVGMLQTASPMSHPWRGLKRILDISFGLLAFVLALPVMAVAAALICMVDPGPVLYGQMRRGLHGQPLKIWKLRSMYQDSQPRLDRILQEDPAAAAEWATRFKLSKDPRILPVVGCFIRKFSLDELPQLWNVIRGDLSLVGPRVFVDYDLDVYSPEALRLRQSVMAGLTGLWQVSVRSDGDNRDKVRYDSAYVRNWSFWMDLDILYRTVGVVLTGRGAT